MIDGGGCSTTYKISYFGGMYQLHPQDNSLPSGRSRRKRPHIYPGGATFSISFRLAGSITRAAFRRVEALYKLYGQRIPAKAYWDATAEERIGFRQFLQGVTDRRSLNGRFYLHHDPVCRQILLDTIAFKEGEHYETLALCPMPNHVHWDVRHTSAKWHMGQLLGMVKSYSAKRSNEHLGLTGNPYWEEESWDRILHTQRELKHSINYTLANAEQAGLVKHWKDWPGTYVHPECAAYAPGGRTTPAGDRHR